MLYAIVNGKIEEAKPNRIGQCPLCHNKVFAKCGYIYNWYWAHAKKENCDSWYEPETEWHKNWKNIFGIQNSEQVISKEGVKHFADVKTKNEVIIEFQNSPIKNSVIQKREEFYGERMLWVVNGIPFEENFKIFKSELDNDELFYLKNNPAKKLNSCLSNPNDSKISELEKQHRFTWRKPRTSWMDAKRNVFIDFGDEYLFYVKEGMGTDYGKGFYFHKTKFISKYQGDVQLIQTIITKSSPLS